MADTAVANGVDNHETPIDEVVKKEIPDPELDGAGEDIVEDIRFYTEAETQGTERCLDNIKLVIRDFETQLDWHLKQYMTIRNMYNSRRGNKGNKNDSMSIAHLSSMIASQIDSGNKRKRNMTNGYGKKRKTSKRKDGEDETDTETEDSEEEEDYDSEEDEDGFYDSEEDVDDPTPAKKQTKKKTPAKRGGKKGGATSNVTVKSEEDDEIVEEFNELVVPKSERIDDDESMDYQDSMGDISSNTGDDAAAQKKTPKGGAKKAAATPAKRGRRSKKDASDEDDYVPTGKGSKAKTPAAKKTPARKGGRGKKGDLQQCSVVLNRCDDDEDKKLGKEELTELIRPKLIDNAADFKIGADKPLVLLEESNAEDFDYETDIKESDFLITYEDPDELPDFIYDNKEIVGKILAGSIKVVLESVYEEIMEKEKKK